MLLDLFFLLDDEDLVEFVPPVKPAARPRPALPVLRLPTAELSLRLGVLSASAVASGSTVPLHLEHTGFPVAAYASSGGVVGVSASATPEAVYGDSGAVSGLAVAVSESRRVVTPLVDDDLILALLLED